MSLTAALLIFAQSAAPQVAEAPTIKPRPVAVEARASVTIMRPALIDFSEGANTEQRTTTPSSPEMQKVRDAAGTPWIEFS